MLAAAIVLLLVRATALAMRGTFPTGPTTRIEAPHASFVTVSVPSPTESGRVWRVARYDSKVVRQVSERFVGDVLVVVFETVEPGTTTIVLAETRGESAVSVAASYFDITVT